MSQYSNDKLPDKPFKVDTIWRFNELIEQVKKDTDWRTFLKASEFQNGVSNTLNPSNDIDHLLEIINFINNLIKTSKDKSTEKFLKDNLSSIVILLGHTKVIYLTLEYSQKGCLKSHFKVLQVFRRWVERNHEINLCCGAVVLRYGDKNNNFESYSCINCFWSECCWKWAYWIQANDRGVT